jgi:cobalt-zinc-cadmium efflux system membrane fusion protein
MKNKRQKIFKPLLIIAGVLLMLLPAGFTGCKGKNKDNAGTQKPAEVINPVKENDLTTVHLSPEAEVRLGIETRKVELMTLPRKLEVGGELIAPPGQEVKVIAPVKGTVIGTEKGYFASAGSVLKKGQEAMRIVVLPPEVDIISASEDLKVKQAEYDVALSEVKRAEKLRDNKALSEKNYETAMSSLVKAEASLKAAKSRAGLYLGSDMDSGVEDLSTYIVESPVSGMIQNISVTKGQSVSASAVLFDISPTDRFWVRVPVYSGDLLKVDQEKDAVVSLSGTGGEQVFVSAKPVSGPQRSDPSSVSSDLYYAVDNKEGMFRIGQKIMVMLTLKSTGENLVVPYSSVIYDMNGSNWIYVRSEPSVYVRKRVELSHVDDTMAVLLRGVSPGEEVVISGVAELYGTEFGGGK